eukprot:CAMPEP_0114599248 /NCGR_PEP_ID=MMETSP0125-20121206/21751_1 /TAXON_ID=485358 ORGANISM="Aristerostoma sp., Strain ATCC 50986" /NCGR_SAMPLE_ID=MMETSP0125 /ASSEMBLY_ACC=CAM_ASM_000245 /LENGTH=172 /DNA_ID=CAMNT_0001806055 /DNA_START=70 /DNA_END=585 /DNA_ORIENTATION=+
MCDIGNAYKEKLVFGGVTLPDNSYLNDVWLINYSNVTFGSALSEIPGTVCTPKKTKGDIPIARKAHGAIVAGKSMLVYGGKTLKDEDEEDVNWIHQLTFENWTWKKISGIARPKTSRAFFSYCPFEDNKLMIFGGIDNLSGKCLNDTYILDLDDYHWSCPFIAGNVPGSRYN